ncbi:MAG TPA: hypothetical protein VIW64_03255 [Pyrinomonadaceae bacterium]
MNLISAKADAILPDPSWNEEMPPAEIFGENDSLAATPESVSVSVAPLAAKDKVFATAYFDTLSILTARNTCSDFFGGPEAAAHVFSRLMEKAQKNPLPGVVAMNMTGSPVEVTDERTNSRYRLFDRVMINRDGPFYRNRVPYSFAQIPRLGSFQANTRQVRVLMFLHELGHAIKGDDGKWLLPDDGKDDELSRRNSQKIEDVCGEQINALRNAKQEQ